MLIIHYMPYGLLKGYALLSLLLVYFTGTSSSHLLHSKYGRVLTKIPKYMIFLIATPIFALDAYREALTAFQLSSLADDFKAKHKHNGTFIYFSQVGHTEGVFNNLKLGKKALERKLKSKKFAVFRPYYRPYIFIETSNLPLNVRHNFLKAAEKAGTSPYSV